MAGIKFELSSVFKGEGFRKARHELKNVGGETKKATGALGQLGGALGNVGGEAGKAVGAIGGLVQGFASMGIVGGIIAAGTLAIEGMFSWLNKANDKAKELAESFKTNLANAAKSVATHVANIAKQYNGLMASLNRGAKNRGVVEGGDLARMGLQKDQALIGKTGEDAAKTEYEWTRKIESEKTKAAKEELADAQKRIALEEKHLAELKKSLAENQQLFRAQNARALDIGNSDADINTKTAAYDAAQVTKRKVTAYQAEVAKVEAELAKLADEKLKAEQALQTQTLAEQVRVQQASQKVADERLKAEEKAAQEAKKAAEEAKKAKEKEAADAKKAAEEKAKQDKEDIEARAKAQKKALDEEIANRRASADATLKAAKDAADRWEAEHADARGKSFKDFAREEKQRAKDEAKAKRKSDAARAVDDARFARLDKAMQRGGRGLSKADRAWYEQYKHWMDAQGKNPHQRNLEDAQMRALAEQRRTAKTLEDIRDELKGQLGL